MKTMFILRDQWERRALDMFYLLNQSTGEKCTIGSV